MCLVEIRHEYCRELYPDLDKLTDAVRSWWFTVYREHIDKTPHTTWAPCRWCDGIGNVDESDRDLGRGIRRYVIARYIEEG